MQTGAQVLFILSTEHKQQEQVSVLSGRINNNLQSRGGSWTSHPCATRSCGLCPSPRPYIHTHTVWL